MKIDIRRITRADYNSFHDRAVKRHRRPTSVLCVVMAMYGKDPDITSAIDAQFIYNPTEDEFWIKAGVVAPEAVAKV